MNKYSNGLFKIVKHSFFWVFVSLALVASSVAIFFAHLRLSIEFTGGIELTLHNVTNQENLVKALEQGISNQGFETPQVNIETNGTEINLLVALPFKSDDQVKEVSQVVNNILIDQEFIANDDDIVGSSLNGPSISSYMKSSAIQAVVVGLILITIYIMFSFAGVRKHISPVILGGVTVASMLFSVIIPLGVYGLWMMFDTTIAIDTIFIISILTVMGYSINDTIIILDRVRENFVFHEKELQKKTYLYGQLIEDSIWQTMRRSLGTGVTLLLVTLTMFIFGTDMLQRFAFTVSAGVTAGMFSSLFFASPLTYLFLQKRKKEFKKL